MGLATSKARHGTECHIAHGGAAMSYSKGSLQDPIGRNQKGSSRSELHTTKITRTAGVKSVFFLVRGRQNAPTNPASVRVAQRESNKAPGNELTFNSE